MELQTHWLGELGSCFDYYDLGERIPQLRGIEAATLGHDAEASFISICGACRGSVEWGARIENEAVVRVWPYQWTAARMPAPI